MTFESVRAKQDGVRGLGVAFAPRNRGQLILRNAVLRLLGHPFVAARVMGTSFRDAAELPVWTPAGSSP